MHPMKSTLVILSVVALLASAGCHRHAMGEGTTVTRNGFTVQIEDGRMVLSDSIHFEFDSDVLAPESHEFLDLIAEVVESHAGIDAVRIEGHTDRLGTPEHNQELSERRAQVVEAVLAPGDLAQDEQAPPVAEHVDCLGNRAQRVP